MLLVHLTSGIKSVGYLCHTVLVECRFSVDAEIGNLGVQAALIIASRQLGISALVKDRLAIFVAIGHLGAIAPRIATIGNLRVVILVHNGLMVGTEVRDPDQVATVIIHTCN